MTHKPFLVSTNGTVGIGFSSLKSPFDTVEMRQDLLGRLNQVPGVSIPPERAASYAGIPFAALEDPVALDGFLAVIEWLLATVQGREGQP